jgi:PAS domain S-box-containing protein
MSSRIIRSELKNLATLLIVLLFIYYPAGKLRAQDKDVVMDEISLQETESQSEEAIPEMEETSGDESLMAEEEPVGETVAVTTDKVQEETSSSASLADHDSTLISSQAAASRQRFPFYRRWWFSLLIVLLAAPFLYRFLNRRNKEQERMIQEHVGKIDELNQQLAQKEEIFAQKEAEFNERLVEEEELKFHAVGLSKFSEIMSGGKEELDKAGQQIIYELVKYLGVNMGAIYTVRGEEASDQVLELLSAYAPDAKQLQAKIHPGEGFVGTCFSEGQMMEITDVPPTYYKISSGLGEATPSYLAFMPLLQDESKLGVIELASFKKLERHKIEFIEKLAQNIANFIAIRSAAARVQEMLTRSQSQSEELQTQEEELRQNLEEMQATQEELNRQMEKNKRIQEDLEKEKYLMDALMDNIPEYIYFKDLESKFLKNSKSLARAFGIKKQKEMIGKSDFDYFNEEHARPAYEGEQEIIRTGKPIIDLVEKEVKKNGAVSWVMTTKMPLYDQNGKIVGTFGISKDITQSKKMEMEMLEKTEELKAQEEEMRQNLEEMQTVQEELERQKAELDWEKHLMDTLLNNLPEYIYFKDKESKFIKNSLSLARIFGFSDAKEIIGKSDFDFFADEHARPAFEDEQKIIKTGKPIINLIEKEVKKDGSVTWASTSKMPLYDKQGKIIGTFGISKDITETKRMEDDLNRRIQENEKIKKEYQKREKELLKKIEELKRK